MFCRQILCKIRNPVIKFTRTFLSENYRCSSEWESRLASPLMQKVNLDNLYYEIDQTFNQDGKASPIDIDIFVNKVNDDTHIDEMSELMHRLRKTEETSNCLESTGHALIRNLYDYKQIDELLQILSNPLEYGVFLDTYMANYIMNDCIKHKNYTVAARISTLLMLQEDFDNDLSRNLSLLACYKYLSSDNPVSFFPDKPETSDDSDEVIKVRVKYIRNEFFDDHFDLKDHKHLVGKTLAMIGNQLNDDIGKNIELLGYVLYQKYDKSLKILNSIKSNEIFYKDILEMSLKFLDEMKKSDENNEQYDKLHTQLKNTLNDKNLKQNKFVEILENNVKDCVLKCESEEIQKQKDIYMSWIKLREEKFDQELKLLQKTERLKHIEKLMKEMKDEEEKLWFFENEEKINLEIENKKTAMNQKDENLNKKEKTKQIDEKYIPPEIIKHRSK